MPGLVYAVLGFPIALVSHGYPCGCRPVARLRLAQALHYAVVNVQGGFRMENHMNDICQGFTA
jgi:hypothetical protein